MKIYLDLLSGSRIEGAYKYNSEKIMALCGGNTGNLVFRHALAQLIDLSDFEYCDYQRLAQLLDQRIKPSIVVLSAANWIGASPQYESQSKFRANLVERCNCPVTIVGLGAQSPSSETKLAIGPETNRFLKILGERTNLIGVRDQFTADILSEQGVFNYTIAGCPSNFITISSTLGKKIQNLCAVGNATNNWSEVRTAISEYSGGNPSAGKILRINFEHLFSYGGFYICQSPILFPFLFRENRELPKPYSDVSTKNKPELSHTFRRSSMHFTCVPTWLDFLRSCDLSFGMRIHGAMMALQAGIPSLLIGHDSRTEGLANTMKVPTVSIDEFVRLYSEGPDSVLQAIGDRLASYDNARLLLASRYLDIFATENIKPKLQFIEFSTTS